MAFDPHKFAQAARDAGYSDDEIVAKIRAQTAPPALNLTDYSKEPAPSATGLGPSTPANIHATREADVSVRDDSGANPVTQFIHRAIPETREYQTGNGNTVPAPDDPVAHDPLAQAVIANQLGWGAGKLLEPAGRIISGAGNAATQTAATGGTPGDIVKGGIIGAAIPAAGMAMGKAARMVREGAGGQARALWEKHGGNVGPLDSGSGVAEVAGIEPSRAGVGKASAIGARNIRAGVEADFEANGSKPYAEMRQAVDYSRASKEVTDVTSLMDTITEAPKALRPAIRRELSDLGATVAPDGRIMMTHADLNEARRRLSDFAKYGLNTGPGTANIRDASFKSLANAAKVLVDEGPYAAANETYERAINMHKADRGALGLNTEPAKLATGRLKEDAKVAQLIRNVGNDSEAAGAMAERADLPGFVSRYPELERQVDLPNLIRAKEVLSFGRGGATNNLIQATEGKGRGAGVLGRTKEAIRHSTGAVAGRYAYRPAGLGLDAEEMLTSPQMANVNPILQAYLAAQQRDKERAAALNSQ